MEILNKKWPTINREIEFIERRHFIGNYGLRRDLFSWLNTVKIGFVAEGVEITHQTHRYNTLTVYCFPVHSKLVQQYSLSTNRANRA